jgi:pimeloyl-ACP methyl ester carboxylesterase
MSPAVIVNHASQPPLGKGADPHSQQWQQTRPNLLSDEDDGARFTDSSSQSSETPGEDGSRQSPLTDTEVDTDSIRNQDEAQAVMQPAMSAAASHYTSAYTPAIEKAAAMDRLPGGGLFDNVVDDNDDLSPLAEASPGHSPDQTYPPDRPTRAAKRTSFPFEASPSSAARPTGGPIQIQRDPMPSPWYSGPKEWLILEKEAAKENASQAQTPAQTQAQIQASSRPSKGALSAAFSATRERSRSRSRSVGQEALKRLQKTFPSLSSPSHLLPSLPTNFFSVFSDKSSSQHSPPRAGKASSNQSLPKLNTSRTDPNSHRSVTPGSRIPHQQSWSPTSPHRASTSHTSRSSLPPPPTRPTLQRASSDESTLYQSLSRVSTLGNDEQFQDVRDMVNMRLQAIRESLPEVPNFKMPTLPKLHTPSFISTNMLSGDNDTMNTPRVGSRDIDAMSVSPTKDGLSYMDQVLADLTGDVVVMGGLRGSVLRSAKPPHQQIWAPVKVGLNMRQVHLEIGLDDEDEERVEETIIPSGMLSHMGPVDISRKLFKKLRNCENARNGKLRVWDYGYDWRLSPDILSRQLRDFLAKLPSNQPGTPAESRGALVIAHSMGGLITRHAVNQAPSLFSGVLFAGTPQRCINILGPIRNGDVILFNEKMLSPEVNFSIRSYYVFLPEDGFCFVDKTTGEAYPIDFFDPEEWFRWRLSPAVEPTLPSVKQPPPPGSGSPSLSSFLPATLRNRAASQSEKWFSNTFEPTNATAPGQKDRTLAPQMVNPGIANQPAATASPNEDDPSSGDTLSDPQRAKNLEYLSRILPRTKKFRAELAHQESHQSSNAYPPLAVLYGKSTPTVYAAQVNGRDGIGRVDAYDDLLFRPGDGVVLAREAMLPEGYVLVNGGRVCTERGHITMLADMHAVGRALAALVKGRKKGIGLGLGTETMTRVISPQEIKK